jgi:pimeloyl-ACP methyl ester carboxylesterase
MVHNFRTWGNAPYRILIVHGGPGAAGELALVSMEISKSISCIELLQTKTKVEEEIQEIFDVISKNLQIPIILVGHSWGALISILFAARFPNVAQKLVLIGCPPLREDYVQMVRDTRWERILPEKVRSLREIESEMDDSDPIVQNKAFQKFGKFYEEIDSFDLDPTLQLTDQQYLNYSYEIGNRIWIDFLPIRRSNRLLEAISKISCPMVFIHGYYDPHPVLGIEEPLKSIQKPYRIHILEKCGHSPWIERYAHQEFYRILKKELGF